MTELFPLDHLGRFPCRSLNHLLQRHPHIHHGGDHVQRILHTAIIASGVNICAQCVGSQTLFESRNGDRKSTRLNSSHVAISYAVFCLKKKNYRYCCTLTEDSRPLYYALVGAS